MTARTFTAMFDGYHRAAEAVRDLEAIGVVPADISLVSNDPAARELGGTGDGAGGTVAGASVGTVIGGGAGLLAGIGLLAIPGLGSVVGAGWLLSTLVGAGVGAALGGLVGTLTGAGVSRLDAVVYAEGIRRGGTLVSVRADDSRADDVIAILDRDGTLDMDEAESAWRRDGWSGIVETQADETAAPSLHTTATSGKTATPTRPPAMPADEMRPVEPAPEVGAEERPDVDHTPPADVSPIVADEVGTLYTADRGGRHGRVRSYDTNP